MPEYRKTDVTKIITLQDALMLIHGSHNYRDRCMFALLYIVPVRPAELLDLKKNDFDLFRNPKTKEAESIEFKLVTKKLKKAKFYPKRSFLITSDHVPNIMFKSVWNYVKTIKDPEQKLFDMTGRNMRYLVDRYGIRILRRHLCPYAFRHQALTRYAREGKGLEDLMYLKGSADVRSISPYLHGKKQEIKIK